MATTAPALDLDQIQGNILAGFNKDHQSFLFLKFTDQTRARAWVTELVDEVATTREVQAFNQLFKQIRARRGGRERGTVEATWMNVAFTHEGLGELGVPQADLDAFPEEFRLGMRQRAGELGDVDDSDPSKWSPPLRDAHVHALLLIASDARDDLEREVSRQLRHAAAHGVQALHVQEGETRSDLPGHEHFGFKDGISQPGIRGFTSQTGADPDQGDPGQDLIFPGEFVLGYPRMKPPPQPPSPGGYNTDPNQVSANPADLENPGEIAQSGPAWTTNGSYLVFRRLRQDVAGFRAFVEEQASQEDLSTDIMGAKLVGRYASGAPLERLADQPAGMDPQQADPSIADPTVLADARINNFEYDQDPDGVLVPRAAHIRKSYPRNEPTRGGGEADTQTHRLLRRGIPFGLPYRASARRDDRRTANPDFPHDRGLLFLCYQTSIANQFEFVQRSWVNDSGFPQPGDGHDPIISQAEANRSFRMPGGKSDHISLMQRWVITTGGEYFFAPSINALRLLAGPS
jgi:Dyp-type peroxidase family